MSTHHYNPDWLSDDALLANFVARQNDFSFLRAELAHAPLVGNVQHYLLVGVRGAGKTTLLKRIAIAIRRDADLSEHLIALSFPEELYQVKNLSDFWLAACDALVDELAYLKQDKEADALIQAIEKNRCEAKKMSASTDAAFKLLQETCIHLQRRPVLLVDNLDMVFERIDKSGRKLKDPHSPAYWKLREALSTIHSPIVIGGSVRLSEAFTGYDKAFYDFFLPKRLGKLSLDEVRGVLEHLAETQNLPEVKERLHTHPARIQALFELTGGNPRALSLIFELLRSGPSSRAVEDFERLMDITTPYYKARIEDLSEQAQVVMHALAVRDADLGLQFGHTAAEIGNFTDLPTSSISAQFSILEAEGLVEKSSAHGRTQYRIAEQLFRLWLQMRATRRIRQNVISLAKFFEAMYDIEELQAKLREDCGASALSEAKYAFAVAGTRLTSDIQKQEIEAYGVDRLRQHAREKGEDINEYLGSNEEIVNKGRIEAYEKTKEEMIDELLAQVDLAVSKDDWIAEENACRKLTQLDSSDPIGWLLYAMSLVKSSNRYDEAEAASRRAVELDQNLAISWTILGGILADVTTHHEEAEISLCKAIELDSKNSLAWKKLGRLYAQKFLRYDKAEAAYRKAIEIAPDYASAWNQLGDLLADNMQRYDEAMEALRKSAQIEPRNSRVWLSLGKLQSNHFDQYTEAEDSYRKAIDLDPKNISAMIAMGLLVFKNPKRYAEAELIFRKVVDIEPHDWMGWVFLASVLRELNRIDEAYEAFTQCLLPESTLPPDMRDDLLIRQNYLLIEICSQLAKKAIELVNPVALHDALERLLINSPDIVVALVSEQFIEGFLGKLLSDSKSAIMVLTAMRNLAYEKHARPLMLAFEAAVENRADMLTEIEPELQGATMHMYERLIGKPRKKRIKKADKVKEDDAVAKK
ncbi:tetratricopeptide repeat protein [Undibacterium sp. Tian12W]|uniref:tetratricopeptide repeat protein n=1 Tax=Undibacterium sp. Tian12W TaxID=3413054 RepID=UPI003BEFC3CB